jgi:two-component system, NarL family, sensor histidine kinase DevS
MADTEDTLRELLDVGEALFAELDPEAVLERILADARRLTGARYAALGVLDLERRNLERFVTAGFDPEVSRKIGHLPDGRGVLGVLINDRRPLRLTDVGAHPESYGFPPAHPAMHTFLGVPVMIRGEAWGNLYLTEKQDGEEFTQADEDAAVALSRWAAIAIENARIHQASEQRREQLARAVRSLEASRDIADAIGSVADLDRVLELIVKRGRALVGARTLLIMLKEGDELVVAASAGHAEEARGSRLPIEGSTSGQVLQTARAERISDVSRHLRIAPASFGVTDANTALLVPMLHRGAGIGVLVAFDHGDAAEAFLDEDERLLRTFAQAAANAVAIKRSVEADRLRSTIAASDAERARWSRELHDQTLQALGALRVLLASNLSRGDETAKNEAMRQAVADIELEIANLRDIISDLRPSLLDDLGLVPALEALVARRSGGALQIESDFSLPGRDQGERVVSKDLETTAYRVVQESLTNVTKHAGATLVRVTLRLDGDQLVVEVADDGRGFDPQSRSSGFGLAGMRERVALVGGSLEVETSAEGTRVSARLPTSSPEPAAAAAVEAAS